MMMPDIDYSGVNPAPESIRTRSTACHIAYFGGIAESVTYVDNGDWRVR